MRNNLHWTCFLALALLLVGSGCASTSAPDDWPSTAQTMQREAYGAWVDVDARPSLTTQGELIAVTADSIFVLAARGPLHSVARDAISELQLVTFDAHWGYLATWTGLGTLSTLSHGFILILSAPVWIIGGSAATSRQSYLPIHTNPESETLRTYARFPQGLPSNLDRDQLRPKPIE